MTPIIPEQERSSEPLDNEDLISHPDMERANEWILSEYVAPKKDMCVFIPSSKSKPFHESPSHRVIDSIIFEDISPEDVHVVVFGTCGIVPRELDAEYPFMNYHFLYGKCTVTVIKRDFIEMESKRLARYLEKTRNDYKKRVAYCIGDFRTAMEKAVEMTGIEVDIVPKKDTIDGFVPAGKRVFYTSLGSKDYLQDLSNAITSATGLPERTVETCEEIPITDNDWYII